MGATQQSVVVMAGGLDLSTPALAVQPGTAQLALNYELPTLGGYRSVQGYERFDGQPLASTGATPAAQAALRAAIQPMSGSGPVLGVWFYNGTVYGWRNNAGGTAAVMWRSTPAGWEQVATPALNAGGFFQFVNYNFYAQSSSLRCYGCDGANPAFEFGGVFNVTLRQRSAANVAQLTTTVPHGLRTNDTVYVYGCGDASFNASAVTVTVVDAYNFSYACNGAAVAATADTAGRVCVFAQLTTGMGGGQIRMASRTRASNVVTVTTASPHNLGNGQMVQVNGCADTSFNSTAVAVTVLSATSFSYANTGANVAVANDAGGLIYAAGANLYPQFIAAHAKMLFLAYPGGSLQFSAVGDPKNWSVIWNAGEIGIGSSITGLASFKGQYLAVGTQRGISTLTGAGPSTWNLVEYSPTLATLPYGMSEIGGQVTWLNALGLSGMQTAMFYGDFQSAILSRPVDPLYFAQLSQMKFVLVSRQKTQLRVFFANGSVMLCHFNTQATQPTTMAMSMPQFTTMVCPTNFVCGSNAGVSGDQIYLGDDQGYVYRMDSGTSFDGNPISCVLRLPFNQFGSPMNKKRFRRVQLEVATQTPIKSLALAQDFDYSDSLNPQPQTAYPVIKAGGAFWDQGSWDTFMWSDNAMGTAVANVDGSGRNMALIINSAEAGTPPYTIQTALISYEERGVQR